MKYFTIKEMCFSQVAQAKNINNNPTKEIEESLTCLINELLDPVREKYGKPITVNSGYRSKELNKAVGGAATSQHLKGEAADITVGSKTENKKLFLLIKDSGLVFDQLIDEKDYSWVHVSYSKGKNRKQVLHL
jgi:hypothetical protein